jgi:hypothetical protein
VHHGLQTKIRAVLWFPAQFWTDQTPHGGLGPQIRCRAVLKKTLTFNRIIVIPLRHRNPSKIQLPHLNLAKGGSRKLHRRHFTGAHCRCWIFISPRAACSPPYVAILERSLLSRTHKTQPLLPATLFQSVALPNFPHPVRQCAP